MAAEQPIVNRPHPSKREIVIPDRVAERAATKYVEDEDGCWISTYSVLQSGYAQIKWSEHGNHHGTTAHRCAWVYFTKKQIPEGMVIDHMCKTKRCVNPDHLRMITNFENARRTHGRDWKLGECANGHSNDHLYWDGWQYRCKPCVLAQARRYREKKRQERDAR